jgi:hypothetical protein
MVAKRPDDRYQTTAELLAELVRCRPAGEPTVSLSAIRQRTAKAAGPRVSVDAPTQSLRERPHGDTDPTTQVRIDEAATVVPAPARPRGAAKRRWPVVAACVLAAAGLVIGAWMYLSPPGGGTVAQIDVPTGGSVTNATGTDSAGPPAIVTPPAIAPALVEPEKPLPAVPVEQPANDAITPANGWINLVPLVDPAQDKVAGDWASEDGQLFLKPDKSGMIEKFSRLAIPIAPAADAAYQVRVQFKTPQEGRGMGVVLPAGKSQALAGVAIIGGLGNIDGKAISAPGNPANCSATLKADTFYMLDLFVRPSADEVEIEARLDDQPLFRWKGTQAALTMPADWAMPDSHVLGLAEWSLVPVTIKEAKFQVLSGTARRLRPQGKAASP